MAVTAGADGEVLKVSYASNAIQIFSYIATESHTFTTLPRTPAPNSPKHPTFSTLPFTLRH